MPQVKTVCLCVFKFPLNIRVSSCLLLSLCDTLTNGIGCLPSTPILPSPSLSAAVKNALVSLSVRSLPSLAKPFRTYLGRDRKAELICVRQHQTQDHVLHLLSLYTVCVCLSVFVSLELLLFYEAAVVGVQHREDLLHVIRRLGLQTHHIEKLLIVKGVSNCMHTQTRSVLYFYVRGQRDTTKENHLKILHTQVSVHYFKLFVLH